jgi:AraC-like DNA-binding protein
MYRLRLLLLLLLPLTALASTCPEVKLQLKQLPNLNVPRSGHAVFVVNGEPTVVGGHTTSFVPTATAEYFRDGQWHLVETAYPHDQGFCVPLHSGQVLIGGGHAEPLGIGQIYSVEMYDPTTHSFKGFGCLDRKRCFVSATEIDSGRVVVSGNWYNNDDIEIFDGQKYFTHVKRASQNRARPFVLRIAKDDVIIFNSTDIHANPIDTIIVDRLKGEPFHVPLFDEWKPRRCLEEANSNDFFIGNEQQGVYSYLIPVVNKHGQVAICRIDSTRFSLLPTNGTIPTTCKGRQISYFFSLHVDRQAQRAYLLGYDKLDGRQYVVAVDLTKTPADLTLYYTDPTAYTIYGYPVLTPEGNLLLTGGMELNRDTTVDNFTPHANVLLLPVGHLSDGLASTETQGNTWLWIAFAALAVIVLGGFIYYRKAHRLQVSHKTPETAQAGQQTPETEQAEQQTTETPSAPASELMQRLNQLMDEQKPFLNSNLKVADVARMLGTNSAYVSNCINSQKGYTFNQYVNVYRIEHAKRLLRHSPDKKVVEVWSVSGFNTETSFFRTFKLLTGQTPTEWKQQND